MKTNIIFDDCKKFKGCKVLEEKKTCIGCTKFIKVKKKLFNSKKWIEKESEWLE